MSNDGTFPYVHDLVLPGGLLPGRNIDVTDVSLHFGDLQLTIKTKEII